jgi:hypothetical protein
MYIFKIRYVPLYRTRREGKQYGAVYFSEKYYNDCNDYNELHRRYITKSDDVMRVKAVLKVRIPSLRVKDADIRKIDELRATLANYPGVYYDDVELKLRWEGSRRVFVKVVYFIEEEL